MGGVFRDYSVDKSLCNSIKMHLFKIEVRTHCVENSQPILNPLPEWRVPSFLHSFPVAICTEHVQIRKHGQIHPSSPHCNWLRVNKHLMHVANNCTFHHQPASREIIEPNLQKEVVPSREELFASNNSSISEIRQKGSVSWNSSSPFYSSDQRRSEVQREKKWPAQI